MSSALISRIAATLGSCSGAAGLEGVLVRAGFGGVEASLTSLSGNGRATSLSGVDFVTVVEVSTDLSSSTAVVVSEIVREGLFSSSAEVSVGEDGFSSDSVAGASWEAGSAGTGEGV